MKKWLENNKIIFETLVAASLTIMGVLVSIAAVFVSVSVNRLTSMQYALDRYGAEPVFTVERKEDKDKLPYYVIKNVGADVHDVLCYGGGISSFAYWHHGKNIFVDVLLKELLNPKFDEKAQLFSFSAQFWEEKINQVVNDVQKIENFYAYDCRISLYIEYKNYRNELCESAILIMPSLSDTDSDFDYSFYINADDYGTSFESDFDVLVDENPFAEVQEALTEYLNKTA